MSDSISSYVPFPLQLMPKRLRRFIEEVARSLDCDPAFVALPALVALASAIGNSRCLRLRPSWRVTAILWAFVISKSGTAKSPSMSVIEGVLHARQKQLNKDHDRAVAEYAAAKEDAEAKMKEWKSNGREGERPAMPAEPTLTQAWAGDVTLEALVEMLLSNDRGLPIFNHEADGWIQSFGQYKSGNGNDEAHWLQLFDGATLKVNRKGSNGGRKFTYVPRPFVGLFGGIQPAVFREAITHRRRKSGLAARILVAMPDQRAMRDTGHELSEATEQDFADLMGNLWELSPAVDFDGDSIPADVQLTPEASQLWRQFVNRNADEQDAADDDERAALAKLRTYAGRLALVIHCVRQAGGDDVQPFACDAQSLQAGIGLTDWFAGEARRVYAMMEDGDDPLADLVAWIKRRGGRATVREVTHGIRRYRGQTDKAARDVQSLVDEGRARWDHCGPSVAGGTAVSYLILVDEANTCHHDPRKPMENGSDSDGDTGGAAQLSTNGRYTV